MIREISVVILEKDTALNLMMESNANLNLMSTAVHQTTNGVHLGRNAFLRTQIVVTNLNHLAPREMVNARNSAVNLEKHGVI
jgi:hypothetical protein